MKRICLEKIADVFNICFLFFLLFCIALCIFAEVTWGEVSLPQILFFVFNGGDAGIDSLFYKIVVFVVLVPLVISFFCIYLLKKAYNGENLFCNPFLLLFVFLGLFFISYKIHGMDGNIRFIYVLYVLYFVNLWRNYSRLNIFISLILCVPLVFVVVKNLGCEHLILSCFEYEETVFYEKKYEYVGDVKFNKDKKRNVILIFAESFENRLSRVLVDDKIYKVFDDDAIKFRDLTEGYSQRWTQGSIFSAFTGAHIHYLSDFYRYKLGNIRPYYEEDEFLIVANKAGEFFNFDTPNIRYLGDITKENGYINIFAKAGKTEFSGTDKLLSAHGFDKENIYDFEYFKKFINPKLLGKWWGAPDVVVFETFKEKLKKLDKNKPFFGVLLTVELHAGDNPFYPDVASQSLATITNLNNFIEWFKQQDFYKDTTLIIVGDHKRMGKFVKPGGDIYNAFFNLPEELKTNLNTNRVFNQIDLFPTILEIMGAEFGKNKAGLGVSLFAGEKTLAEEYSYDQQEKVFSKIDRFYQRLWEDKFFMDDKIEKNKN